MSAGGLYPARRQLFRGMNKWTFLIALCSIALPVQLTAQENVVQALPTKAASVVEMPAPELYEQAAQLRAQGLYAEADRNLAAYGERTPLDSRVWRQANAAVRVPLLLEQKRNACTLTGINVPWRGTRRICALRGSEVYIVADPSRTVKDLSSSELDLCTAHLSSQGTLEDLSTEGPWSTKADERHICFSADGHTAFVTRNVRQGKAPVSHSELYIRSWSGGAWQAERPFERNSTTTSTGHAALTPDGQRLYFASDRPGGVGGSDIWYCERAPDGSWNEAVNAGMLVNTEGQETSPAITAEGDLCFASDGHLGLGGSDLFVAHVSSAGMPGRPRNLGAPLNSALNEVALLLDSTARRGFMTRELASGIAAEEIYAVWFHRVPGFDERLDAEILDQRNSSPISDAQIALLGADGQPVMRGGVQAGGRATLDLDKNEDLFFEASMSGFRTKAVPVSDLRKGPYRCMLPWLQQVGLWMHVANSQTGDPLDSATISINDVAAHNTVVMRTLTSGSGDARTSLYDRAIGDSLLFRIALNKPTYYPRKGLFAYKVNEYGEIPIHQKMDPSFLDFKTIKIGDEIGRELHIKPIFFGAASDSIFGIAKIALDQIAEVLFENKYIVVEVGSHTDSRGNTVSNGALSKRRAKATVQYLMDKGIDEGRLIVRGYGESKLLNRCHDGVKCTDAEHAENRRTEFIVLDL
jgi:outer membrane protein OmpA-like peptidoglycan-associated protein